MGIRLSDAGMGDYWDDVDALARNHLVEQQFTDAERLAQVSAAAEECDRLKEAPHDGQVDTRDVIKRSLGNFAGSSAPDSIPNPWVMQCCTANGTQGLYYAWEGIVRQSAETAQVNLLLNRSAEGLDVDSYLPYEGKVVIHNKKMERVSVAHTFLGCAKRNPQPRFGKRGSRSADRQLSDVLTGFGRETRSS